VVAEEAEELDEVLFQLNQEEQEVHLEIREGVVYKVQVLLVLMAVAVVVPALQVLLQPPRQVGQGAMDYQIL